MRVYAKIVVKIGGTGVVVKMRGNTNLTIENKQSGEVLTKINNLKG